LGFAGAIATFVGFAGSYLSLHYLWLAIGGLFMHWLGDSLDGHLARYRQIERPKYGFFVDQNIDVIGNLLIILGLCVCPFVSSGAALFALCGYHMLTIYSLIEAHVERSFRITLMNVGPTEVRVLLAGVALSLMLGGAPEWRVGSLSFTWADAALVTYGLACVAIFIWLFVKNGLRLRKAGE
jgi:phosphatidylglycerophosphate synthase